MLPRISALYFYPLKGGGPLEAKIELFLGQRGPKYDREWMLVNNATGEFLSQRSHPKLALIRPRIVNNHLYLSAAGVLGEVSLYLPFRRSDFGQERLVTVHGNACFGFDCDPAASAWFSSYLDTDCRLVRSANSQSSNVNVSEKRANLGFADSSQILIISEESLNDLNKRLAAKKLPPVPMNRFRPNIVIVGAGVPYWEDLMTGKTWAIGPNNVKVKGKECCPRCDVTTLNQTTGEKEGKEPLRTLSGYRRTLDGPVKFGVNAVNLSLGPVHVGDRFFPSPA